MKKENMDMLEDVLANYQTIQEFSKQEKRIEKEKRKEFLHDFEKLCVEKLRPVMEDIGKTLKANGHDFEIYFRKEHRNERGMLLNQMIKMNIFPNGKHRINIDNSMAYIMFFAEKNKEEIGVEEKTIRSIFKNDSSHTKFKNFTLSSITTSDIEKEIVESIGNIFLKKQSPFAMEIPDSPPNF